MGLKFNLTEIRNGVDLNLRICFLGQVEGNSILSLEGDNFFTLREEIARNLMNILKTNQILDNRDIKRTPEFGFKGLFSDCHSFALSLTTGCSNIGYGPLKENFLIRSGFEKIGILNVGDRLPILQQGDLLTTEGHSFGHHSMVYLGSKNFFNQNIFIHCRGCVGYIDSDGKYHELFNNSIFDKITTKIDEKIYVKEGYRVGGRLSLDNIEVMYNRCKCYSINKIGIYRNGKFERSKESISHKLIRYFKNTFTGTNS